MIDTTIEDFCRELMRDQCLDRMLEPEGLAADFTCHFQLPLRIPLDDLAVLLESAGIGMVAGRRLKKGLRGVHYLQPDGSYAIHYEEDQWEGGKVHTVLHETCEILHETVGTKQPGTVPTRALCQEADRFAAAVMMPPETFAACAQAAGLDVPALQRLFRCAYRSVTLRLGGGDAPSASAGRALRTGGAERVSMAGRCLPGRVPGGGGGADPWLR